VQALLREIIVTQLRTSPPQPPLLPFESSQVLYAIVTVWLQFLWLYIGDSWLAGEVLQFA